MATSEHESKPTVPAVRGENTGQGGVGVEGISHTGLGMRAASSSGRGLEASSETDYGIRASSGMSAGLRASSVHGRGAEGWSTDHEGVVGTSKTGIGVYGTGTGVAGVVGDSETGTGRGVEGRSDRASGVFGVSREGRGVEGWSTSAYGVSGDSRTSAGMRGTSVDGRGVEGWSTNSEGVVGIGKTGGYFEGSFEGVHAVSHDPHAAGVAGYNDKTGPGIFGKSTGGGPAGYFDGNLVVTGDIQLAGADLAEEFVSSGSAAPGNVVVLDDTGGVLLSPSAYNRRVAGVVAGAGDFRSAIVMARSEGDGRVAVALVGRVACLVDADAAPIQVGDLLTTSDVPGHAMTALDRDRAFGAVIGKALRAVPHGRALIPILVALQ